MIRIKVARTFDAPNMGNPPLRCLSYYRMRHFLVPSGEGAPKGRIRGSCDQRGMLKPSPVAQRPLCDILSSAGEETCRTV